MSDVEGLLCVPTLGGLVSCFRQGFLGLSKILALAQGRRIAWVSDVRKTGVKCVIIHSTLLITPDYFRFTAEHIPVLALYT